MSLYSRWIFPLICDLALDNDEVAELRRGLLAPVRGEILEIGIGTGLNLPCYPKDVRRITAVEPNPGMNHRAKKRQSSVAIEVDRHQLDSARLPFADASFDFVVSTFTLCSIGEVERAMGEVCRVLRPDGQFLFLEHGLSPDPGVQKWQRRLNWLERLVADGCQLDRPISAIVQAQPFAKVEVEESYLKGAPRTHGYLYRGTARR